MSGRTLASLQSDMGEWAAAHLTTDDPMLAALKVCEEAGELAGAIVKACDGSNRPSTGSVDDELADVVLAACTCASFLDVDLAAAVSAKLAELNLRAEPTMF